MSVNGCLCIKAGFRESGNRGKCVFPSLDHIFRLSMFAISFNNAKCRFRVIEKVFSEFLQLVFFHHYLSAPIFGLF